MTIDEAIHHLNTWSTTHGSGQTTDKQHEEAKKIAIATMLKYQKLQADFEARLKADVVAMLTDVQLQIEEIEMFTNTFGWELRAKTPEEIKKECSEIIQQKIDKLKEETEVKGDKS